MRYVLHRPGTGYVKSTVLQGNFYVESIDEATRWDTKKAAELERWPSEHVVTVEENP